jgi:hypothetical protein
VPLRWIVGAKIRPTPRDQFHLSAVISQSSCFERLGTRSVSPSRSIPPVLFLWGGLPEWPTIRRSCHDTPSMATGPARLLVEGLLSPAIWRVLMSLDRLPHRDRNYALIHRPRRRARRAPARGGDAPSPHRRRAALQIGSHRSLHELPHASSRCTTPAEDLRRPSPEPGSHYWYSGNALNCLRQSL